MKNTKEMILLIALVYSLPGLLFSQNTSPVVSYAGLGVSQVNITPDSPTLMSGYDSRITPYTEIHDSLYASALFFSYEREKVLLITADLIGFPFEFIDDTKNRISSKIGIPAENILIVATHNHGGPSIDENGPESVRLYTGELKKKLTEMAFRASKNVVPFRIGIGKGYCNMNINRRAEYAEGEIWIGENPDGPCDHELDVVKFESMDNKTLAVLINWPCHGTVTGYSNFQITGDWPGAAARYIKQQTGEDVVVAVTAGASADINSIYRPSDSFRRVEAVGYHVGRETNHVFSQIETLPVKFLQTIETTLYFPGKERDDDHFPKTSYRPGPEKEIRLSVTKIGNLVFAGISGELMTEIGMEIKEQSPYSGTMVFTHCNGSSGYICTDKSYPEGGYEVQVTEFMPGVERGLIREFAGLIDSFE